MRWVGFVRNVMVGREGLSREVLLDLVALAGGMDAKSRRSTGNVSFDVPAHELDHLVDALESAIAGVLGRREMVAVRLLDAIRDLVAHDVFAGFDDSWETEVGFLRHDAEPIEAKALGDPQRTVVVGLREREILTARPREGGRRPHVNGLAQRATGQPSTSRGWSTLEWIVRKEYAGARPG